MIDFLGNIEHGGQCPPYGRSIPYSTTTTHQQPITQRQRCVTVYAHRSRKPQSIVTATHPTSRFFEYIVEILSKSKKSYNRPWEFTAKSQRYSHPRVFIISGDLFYEQVAGRNAMYDLFRVLPIAISDFLVEHPKVVESEIEAIKQVLEIQDKSSQDDEFSFSYFFKQAYPKLDRKS